ncbi:hypothetical protein K4L44_12825 [Halosquirtibacter laminarini]|uniref:Uncharacterized protein n=1 Tax=Halosquirtibacter laminarini TaxID=3374600 RepID=A0AC61NN30_9BACT|nr:hypothetical protein K4L44_12825 [Prolixibacteraceae bacterium]
MWHSTKIYLFVVLSLWCSLFAKADRPKNFPSTSIWTSVWDTEVNDVAFKKVGNKLQENLTVEELVLILNKTLFLDIEVVGLESETLKIKINDSETLTEHMGSSGAKTCLGIITFTLTENSQVKMVDMDFEYGSHASPGVYSRINFIQAF